MPAIDVTDSAPEPPPAADAPRTPSAIQVVPVTMRPGAALAFGDVVVADSAALRRHWLASSLPVLPTLLLLLAGRAWHEALVKDGQRQCSAIEQLTDECPCVDMGFAESLPSKLVWTPTFVLSYAVYYRMARVSLGAPKRPRLTWLAVVWLPAAAFLLLTTGFTVGASLLFAALIFVLAMLSWHPDKRAQVLKWLLPIAWHLLSVLPYRLVFIEWLPGVLRRSSDETADLVMLLLQVLLVVFQLVSVRVLHAFSGSWSAESLSLMLRRFQADSSAQRLGAVIMLTRDRDLRVTDLTPWHPFVLAQLLYVVSQLVTRQNGLTVLRGRMRGWSNEYILARQSPLLAMYGSCKDWRYLTYVGVAMAALLRFDFATQWSALCDGRYHDFLGDKWLIVVLFCFELVVDALLWLFRRRLPENTPFRSIVVVGPAADTAMWAYTLMLSAIVGVMIGATALAEL